MQMDEDDDSFLYGETIQPIPQPPAQKIPTEVPQLVGDENDSKQASEDGLSESTGTPATGDVDAQKEEKNTDGAAPRDNYEAEMNAEGDDDEEEEEAEESDDDIEFILEAPTRSLDFRSQRAGPRPSQTRTPSTSAPTTQPINLTTEYTPRERAAPAAEPPKGSTSQALPGLKEESQQWSSLPPSGTSLQPTAAAQHPSDDGPDPSTLPPVRAPPSHPSIDPSIPGIVDGRSIFEIDMTNLAEKPWRRPGADISDWFNYGFDEISWEAYCYRRRDLGELASVLKANVLGFAGMGEEPLLALPPEVRTMVMTGTNAMMGVAAGGGGPGHGVGVGPGMLPPGMGPPMGPMNPMMADMSQMGGMGVPMSVGMPGPMGPMGMNGDMGVGMQGPGPGPNGAPMMPDGIAPGPMQVQMPNSNNTPDQGRQPLPEGMVGGPLSGPNMMNMNMGDMGLQDGSGMPQQHMHHNIESSGTPVQGPVGRGSAVPTPVPTPFRGRGMVVAPRGRGQTFAGRGRGALGQQPPLRPASPLPPNVPTGPRNPGVRYKDRDNNAPAVDGLDYGGGVKEGSAPVERERDRDRDREREREREVEEKSSRKRRSPPSNEEDRMGRSSKRR